MSIFPLRHRAPGNPVAALVPPDAPRDVVEMIKWSCGGAVAFDALVYGDNRRLARAKAWDVLGQVGLNASSSVAAIRTS